MKHSVSRSWKGRLTKLPGKERSLSSSRGYNPQGHDNKLAMRSYNPRQGVTIPKATILSRGLQFLTHVTWEVLILSGVAPPGFYGNREGCSMHPICVGHLDPTRTSGTQIGCLGHGWLPCSKGTQPRSLALTVILSGNFISRPILFHIIH